MKYAKKNYHRNSLLSFPTIHAWDAGNRNIVGQQYMIMEKIEGVRFSDVWDDATSDQKRYVVERLARFACALH